MSPFGTSLDVAEHAKRPLCTSGRESAKCSACGAFNPVAALEQLETNYREIPLELIELSPEALAGLDDLAERIIRREEDLFGAGPSDAKPGQRGRDG